MQRPPFSGGFWFMAGYVTFLLFLLRYYQRSLFVVVHQVPARRADVPDSREGSEPGPGRWKRLGSWGRKLGRVLLLLTWWLPDLTASWLVAWASNTDRDAGWIARLTRVPEDSVRRTLRALPLVLVALGICLAGIMGFACPDSSDSYTLAGVFCNGTVLSCLLIGAWLTWQAVLSRKGATEPGPIGVYLGRILGWSFLSMLGGELLWLLACSDRLGSLISYRFYTIWAIVHLLSTLIILGLFADRWHEEASWPVRPAVLVVLLAALYWFTLAATVGKDDVEHHLTRGQREALKNRPDSADGKEERNRQWFEQFQRRVEAIPEGSGPVVIVAASGGGSRAAIFTALALETLTHTPLKPGQAIFPGTSPAPGVRTWADNVVFFSSVSGGSLATAYYVQRLDTDGRPREPRTVGDLRNTTRKELLARLERLAETRLLEFSVPEGDDATFFRSYLPHYDFTAAPDARLRYLRDHQEDLARARRVPHQEIVKLRDEYDALKKKPEAPDPAGRIRDGRELRHKETEIVQMADWINTLDHFLANVESYHFVRALNAPQEPTAEQDRFDWVLRSRAFDDTCLDFMAPIMRGSLSVSLDRGDSLARFWTDRYGWYDCTNFSGYGGSVLEFNYKDYHPLVVFNASDVARGTRVAVGFPVLPADFWPTVYRKQEIAHEPPRSLSELDPSFRVSLARAVRMSSNFPFAFRVMDLAVKDPSPKQPLHLLDGGVVDNTGLDTLYELFQALAFYADKENASAYGDRARAILEGLRKRGVVILEIDAGAKPNGQLAPNPLPGLSEPIQALDNAAYTGADQVKALYLKRVRRILNRNLDGMTDDPRTAAALAPLRENLPVTTLHLRFQCNHYQAGQEQGRDVMTAWTLGPADKAEVVQRFLIELALWDKHRGDALDDLNRGMSAFRDKWGQARARLLLEEVVPLSERYARLVKSIGVGQPLPKEKELNEAEALWKQSAELARKYRNQLNRDPALAGAWEEFRKRAQEFEKKLRSLVRNADPAPTDRDETCQAGQKCQAALEQVRKQVQRLSNPTVLLGDVAPVCDPQQKYDRMAKTVKDLYEKPRRAKD
jgi:hypothetical protein